MPASISSCPLLYNNLLMIRMEDFGDEHQRSNNLYFWKKHQSVINHVRSSWDAWQYSLHCFLYVFLIEISRQIDFLDLNYRWNHFTSKILPVSKRAEYCRTELRENTSAGYKTIQSKSTSEFMRSRILQSIGVWETLSDWSMWYRKNGNYCMFMRSIQQHITLMRVILRIVATTGSRIFSLNSQGMDTVIVIRNGRGDQKCAG